MGQNSGIYYVSRGGSVIDREASFVVRKANVSDGEGVLACLAAAFTPYRDQYTREAFAGTVLTEETLKRRLTGMCLFVAVSRGRIVGTIGSNATGHEGHLRGMAVVPEWQGTDVASALLHAAEEGLRNDQCTRVTLDTTEPLKRAMRFYEKNGYAASGRVSEFFGMPLFEYVKHL